MAHGLLPAVAQYNHKPQFPLSNTSRGLAGRNFLVLHDTGAPVKHISILGRPATWGYFFSDLRRGMSWHSMFPLFFSIFAFWFFFNTLHPAKCLWNLLFALAAVFTSTSAMWSFWPAYNCAGIFLALAAVMRLLRSRKWHQVLLWGLLMGWSVSVSALTIYFPRIWPGCLVAGFLFVGWVLENRALFLADKVKKVCGILAGVILFVLLISLWYDAVKDQIEIILNSVYPGKRIGWGGTASLWMLISAWFSCIFTVKTAFSLGGNECESQMMLLVFTVVPLLIFTWKNLNRKWLIAFSAAVLLVFFWFMYIGLSPLIAKLSLLERCQVRRMAYPVDLGFLALLSLLVHNCRGDGKISAFKMFCYSAVTFFPLLALFYLPRQDCQFLWLEDTRMMILSVIAVYIFISMTLVLRPKFGIALFLLFNIGNGIYFNPLCIAPEKIESPTVNALRAEKGREKYEGRILTFSYPLDTSLYSAVGGKTFNGHFVPEDMQIFDLLFKNLPDPERFHRQNHMCFFVRDANAPLLEASIPAYQGEIDVAVNGVRFDFTTLPIDYVVTSVVPWADVLKQNKTLRYLGKSGNRARFKVLHPVQPVGK